MLNTNIRPLVASDIDKAAKYIMLEFLPVSAMFLYNNLTHIKVGEDIGINLHTGIASTIPHTEYVIEVCNPTLTGTIRVC